MKGTGAYTQDWPEIAKRIKAKCGARCERCGHADDTPHGYTFTVHHLDGQKGNNADWNLAGLCQRCHLRIQGRVFLPQFFMFEHSAWFRPHVEGYLQSLKAQTKELA